MSLMNALVKKEATMGLWLDQVPVPEVGINDVKVRIMKTAICGTDLHIYNWDAWAQKTIPVPMTIGHEFDLGTAPQNPFTTQTHPLLLEIPV